MSPFRLASTRLGAGILIIGALLLSACNAGGGGGPVPGSDEDTKQQTDNFTKQARAELDSALKKVEPCSTDQKQIANVLNPWGTLQKVGTNTDADDKRVRDALAPVARTIGRAFARGENVGLDAKGVERLAGNFGIDTAEPDWMEDDQCERNWSVSYRLDAPQGGPGGLLIESGGIDITVAANGTVAGSGSASVTFSAKPTPPCETSPASSSTTMAIGGTLKDKTFSFLLNRASYTLAVNGVCHTPLGDISTPTPIVSQPFDALAVKVQARSGASGVIELPSGGTLSVTVLRRR